MVVSTLYFLPGSIRVGLRISVRYPEVDCCFYFVFCTQLDPSWAAYQRAISSQCRTSSSCSGFCIRSRDPGLSCTP